MIRRKILSEAKTVVVKVGTRLVVRAEGGLDRARMERIADEFAAQAAAGRRMVLTTSGAVGAGMAVLGYEAKPKRLAEKQACAAVGQIRLMHAWEEAFARKGIAVAQILLTAEDFRSAERYANVRATFDALVRRGVVPIVNENDTVATAEIKVGDNDTLSADVCHFLGADLLVLLTDIDGLYTANPKTDASAQLIPLVGKVTPEIEALAGGAGSAVSTGGMITKIRAAKQVTRSGSACLIANGFTARLADLLEGAPEGTLFLPGDKKVGARKRWIAFLSKAHGKLLCDEGAVAAVVEGRRSLLPAGVRRVEGSFPAGAVIDICTLRGRAVARGLAAWRSADLEAIAGRPSAEIPALVGRDGPSEAVHRDNLFVLD